MTIQLALFDLPEAKHKRRRKEPKRRYPVIHYPRRGDETYCAWCGEKLIGSILGMHSFWSLTKYNIPACNEMHIAIVKVDREINRIKDRLTDPTYTNSIAERTQSLRDQLVVQRKNWGRHTDEYDRIVAELIIKKQVFKYTLDPTEYPWEYEQGA